MSYDSVIAAASPAAWWKLADGSGSTAADSSGHGWTGSASNVTFGEASTPVAGNTTALFNGSNSSITTSWVPGGLSALTIEIWANLDGMSLPSYPVFFDNGTPWADNNGAEMHIESGDLRFRIGNGSTFADVFTGSLPASGWAYVVGTYDGANAHLYMDATLLGSSPLTGNIGVSGYTSSFIGYGAGGLSSWPGLLAECAVYSYALTPTQVAAHYAAASGSTPSGTVPVLMTARNELSGRGSTGRIIRR